MFCQCLLKGLPLGPAVSEGKEAALVQDFTLVLSQETLQIGWLNGVLSCQIDITCVKDERSGC